MGTECKQEGGSDLIGRRRRAPGGKDGGSLQTAGLRMGTDCEKEGGSALERPKEEGTRRKGRRIVTDGGSVE